MLFIQYNWANHGASKHVRNMYRAGWNETFGEFVKRTIKKALFDFMFPALLEFLNRCMAMKILQWPIKNHSLYGPYFTPIWSNQATYFSILVLSTINHVSSTFSHRNFGQSRSQVSVEKIQIVVSPGDNIFDSKFHSNLWTFLSPHC